MTMKLFDFDDSLWKKFKKKCFDEDVTLKSKITELIKGYVEGD